MNEVCLVHGKNIVKVAEKIDFNPDFAIVYTTENLDENTVKNLKNIINCPFIGCYTEEMIINGKLKKGTGILALKGVKAITETTSSPEKAGRSISILEKGSTIIFTSWMNKNISRFLRLFYNQLSYNFSYIGGCVGKYKERKSIHFTDKGIGEREGSFAGININMKISYDHGWDVFSGPYIITKSFENLICELDGKNAIDVYCRATGCCIEDFEKCRKFHPFGFLYALGEYILRSPINFKDECIEMLSDLPNSSVTVVMNCEVEDILNAAENAAMNSIAGLDNSKFALIFDCISRKEILGKLFKEEIKIFDEIIDIPYIGILSIGEFISTEKIYIPNFHNKTVVISVGVY